MLPFQEDMWAVSVLTGQGYTPEPSDLERLIDIDSKIRLLLPVEECLSVQSSYTNLSLSQVCVQQHYILHSNNNGFIQSAINSSRHHPGLLRGKVIKSYYKVSSVGHRWQHLVKSFVTDPQGVTPLFVSGGKRYSVRCSNLQLRVASLFHPLFHVSIWRPYYKPSCAWFAARKFYTKLLLFYC